MTETITKAAVHVEDGQPIRGRCTNLETGYLATGRRHNTCISDLNTFYGTTEFAHHRYKGRVRQGFITSSGRYVDRVEAAQIAYAAGQIPEPKRELYSEDCL